MTFTDILQNQLLDEFSSITLGTLLTAILLSFVLGLFIALIYKVTYSGAMFSKGFALCLILLSMITSLVILTISSNVVLSLGMVGALSIVRFRTAVKEPLDTVFMFWAIAVGIITGAGYVPVAIIATLLIGALFVILTMCGIKFSSDAYLVVIHYESSLDDQIETLLKSKIKYRIKSKNMNPGGFELVLETRLSGHQMEKVRELQSTDGIHEIDLISYNGSTML